MLPFHALSRLKGIETSAIGGSIRVFTNGTFHALSRLKGIETDHQEYTLSWREYAFHALSRLKGIETQVQD